MGNSKKSDDDHLNAESLVGRAIPQNQIEKQAAAEHLAEQIVTGKDPIPRSIPDWAKELPSPKK